MAARQRLGLTAPRRAFIERQRVAHLATSLPDGTPHVVPVTFVLIGDAICSAVDAKPKRTTELQRVRNVRDRPAAGIVFDEYDEDWSRLGWVMLRGRADVLDSGAERDDALAALRAKYPQYRDVALVGPVVRVHADRVTAWGTADD